MTTTRALLDAAGRWVALAPPRARDIRYLGWVGHKNLGDEALFEAVSSYLRPVRLFSVPKAPRALHSCVTYATQRTPTILGGGTLIGGQMRPVYAQAACQARAAVFGTGVIDPTFPHSYRSVDAEIELTRWVELLAESKYVGVRGPLSAAILKDRGLDVEVLGDPAARFVQSSNYWRPDDGFRVGINVGHAFGRVWGSELKLLSFLVDFATALRSAGATIEYFVVWPRDLPFARQVARESGTEMEPIRVEYASAAQFQASVRRLNAFVGLKLHAAALAAAAGVPTISLEYQPKCRDFMATIGSEDLCFRTDNLDLPLIVDVVRTLVGSGHHRSQAQLDALGRQHERQAEVGRRLRSELSND